MNLHNKKVAVLGLGREGQALADYFKAEKITADFLDEKSGANLSGVVSNHIKTGKEAFDDLGQYDIIFRSPGINPEHPKVAPYKSHLTSLSRFFFELWPGKIIGVTGTKGKGTTASLIKEILDKAKLETVLVGNIGNVNLLDIERFSNDSWAVVELSSFQLLDLGISPHIAVVLDVTGDHLDYHGNLQEYVAAKLEIVRNQKLDDWLIITGDNPKKDRFLATTKGNIVEIYLRAHNPKDNIIWWDNEILTANLSNNKSAIIKAVNLKIIGNHNRINAAAAAAAGLIVGVDKKIIAKALSDFRGMSMRLENVGNYQGVTYINDSASTNPQTVIAAIEAMAGPTILLMGGRNKGLNYNSLVKYIAKNQQIKRVVAYGEIGLSILDALEKKGYKKVLRTGKMAEAIQQAKTIAVEGDTILLSPGAASFDEYDNYHERGQTFNRLIK